MLVTGAFFQLQVECNKHRKHRSILVACAARHLRRAIVVAFRRWTTSLMTKSANRFRPVSPSIPSQDAAVQTVDTVDTDRLSAFVSERVGKFRCREGAMFGLAFFTWKTEYNTSRKQKVLLANCLDRLCRRETLRAFRAWIRESTGTKVDKDRVSAFVGARVGRFRYREGAAIGLMFIKWKVCCRPTRTVEQALRWHETRVTLRAVRSWHARARRLRICRETFLSATETREHRLQRHAVKARASAWVARSCHRSQSQPQHADATSWVGCFAGLARPPPHPPACAAAAGATGPSGSHRDPRPLEAQRGRGEAAPRCVGRACAEIEGRAPAVRVRPVAERRHRTEPSRSFDAGDGCLAHSCMLPCVEIPHSDRLTVAR